MITPYKYYSPVTDVTFRKVFGEHIDLTASLLNTFLPLEDGHVITDIQYIPPEMMTEKTRKPDSELLADPDVAKAIELLEIINYTEAEQELYDRYWDAVSVEATWKTIGWREGGETWS